MIFTILHSLVKILSWLSSKLFFVTWFLTSLVDIVPKRIEVSSSREPCLAPPNITLCLAAYPSQETSTEEPVSVPHPRKLPLFGLQLWAEAPREESGRFGWYTGNSWGKFLDNALVEIDIVTICKKQVGECSSVFLKTLPVRHLSMIMIRTAFIFRR